MSKSTLLDSTDRKLEPTSSRRERTYEESRCQGWTLDDGMLEPNSPA